MIPFPAPLLKLSAWFAAVLFVKRAFEGGGPRRDMSSGATAEALPSLNQVGA
jgi:hypothetical protein